MLKLNTVLPPNNYHPKCRQNAVFIWNGLYSEVFMIHEKNHSFQNVWLLLGCFRFLEWCYWEGNLYSKTQLGFLFVCFVLLWLLLYCYTPPKCKWVYILFREGKTGREKR